MERAKLHPLPASLFPVFEDLLTGGEGNQVADNGTNITRILYNDGAGVLTNGGISLPAWSCVALACGDIFNHGRNDIVMCGYDAATGYRTMVFRNDGNQFTPVDFGLRPIGSQTGHGLDLADYDEDGRLDLAAAGGNVTYLAAEPTDDAVSVYRNTLGHRGEPTTGAPGALASSVGPGSVVLSWTNAVDDITPKNLLTYNVCVTTVPRLSATNASKPLGSSSYTNLVKVSPLASFVTGKRKAPQRGNCGHAYRHPYRLPPGVYYWSVQAIDGGYAGGPWAPEQSFTITEPERPAISAAKDPNGILLSWPARFADYQMEFSDSVSSRETGRATPCRRS